MVWQNCPVSWKFWFPGVISLTMDCCSTQSKITPCNAALKNHFELPNLSLKVVLHRPFLILRPMQNLVYLYVGREDYKTDGWPLKQNLMTYNDEAMNKCFRLSENKYDDHADDSLAYKTSSWPIFRFKLFARGTKREAARQQSERSMCTLIFRG